MKAWLLAGCCLLVASAASQQTPARNNAAVRTGVVSGTVVTDDTAARPIRRAQVQLRSVDVILGSVEAITDESGTFTFSGLLAGRYYLSASKAGMVTVTYGAKRPNGPGSTVSLSDGQKVTGISLRMSHGAVITGTVRDIGGEPAGGVRVNVMRYSFGYQSGERELQSVRSAFGEETDDRGQYRVYGLPPGEYVVVVTAGMLGSRFGTDAHQTTAADVQWAMRQIQDAARTSAVVAPPVAGPNVDYAPIFYPGTASQAGAGTITLAAGEERSGVDIPIVLVPTAKIEGTVTVPDGVVPANLQVNLMAHQRIAGLPFSGFGTVPQVTGGKFTITGLAPGDYTIVVRPRPGPSAGRGGAPPAGAVEQFAIEVVTVSGADVAVTLPLRTGVAVSGRLAFDGSSLPPPTDLTKARISLTAVVTGSGAALGASPATVDASGAFVIRGVAPGRYRVQASIPGSSPTAGWQLRSAAMGGADAVDVPFEVQASDVGGLVVTFTDTPAELSGVIQDPAGQPAPEYFVIVFTRDRALWAPQSRRIQGSRAASNGRFVFRNLPPGDYALGALTDVEQNEWYDPEFLKKLLPNSIPITIAPGEKKVQDIRIAGLDLSPIASQPESRTPSRSPARAHPVARR